MPVDTAEKRFSMLNFGDGTNVHLLFQVDGAVDLDDRQHLLDCYSGILFEGGAVIRSGGGWLDWFFEFLGWKKPADEGPLCKGCWVGT